MSDDQGTVDDQASPTACACRAWWRVAVVVVLAAAVAGVIASRAGRDASSAQGPAPAGRPALAQSAALPAADNPLDRALATGRPVVADFGRGMCIPCKMMKPILDDLKEDYAGRAEILVIDVDQHPAVTQRVGIRAIPTQVFYDAERNVVYRHEGFIPREDIVAKLAEMGVR